MIVVDGCPFCDKAIQLANKAGVLYYVEDATGREKFLTEMKQRFSHNTVPIINWVGSTPEHEIVSEVVGGFTEFKERLNVEQEAK